jgi:hypothetical protein
VEPKQDVPRRVREVEADDASLRVREPRDRLDLERLARVVLDSGEQDHGDRRAVALQDLGDARDVDHAGRQPHERLGGIEAVQPRLRLERVVVRRKRAVLEEDAVPLARRTVEARHHQVQIDRQRVHRHDLARGRSHEPRHRLGEEFVVRHPRVLAREVRLHGEPPPRLELLLDVPRRSLRQEPERVAGEVDLLLAGRAPVSSPSSPAGGRGG